MYFNISDWLGYDYRVIFRWERKTFDMHRRKSVYRILGVARKQLQRLTRVVSKNEQVIIKERPPPFGVYIIIF